MSYKVLITDRAWPDVSVERAILSSVAAEIVEAPSPDETALIALAADADAIMTCWAQVGPRVIEAAPRLKVVARFGIGLDNIAVASATARGIPVTNVPDYCVDEVADHTFALLLACARNVAFFHAQTKQGEYDLKAGPAMRRLRGQVLGIVGLGRIGQAVARRAQAFGLRVIACTRRRESIQPVSIAMQTSPVEPVGLSSSNAAGADANVRFCTLRTLLRESDFISLHAPLTDETRHLIAEAELALMKPTAYLINTSRGALVDQATLSEAVLAGRLAGAALDVFDPEPPDLTAPLFRSPRIIVTPHAAFWSEESLLELRRRAAEQTRDALAGRRPANVVNPAVYT